MFINVLTKDDLMFCANMLDISSNELLEDVKTLIDPTLRQWAIEDAERCRKIAAVLRKATSGL